VIQGDIFVERLWRNAKHEDEYLKGYATVAELTVGLIEYFAFYNGERPHQALDYRTPDEVHASGVGGGASIPDHFSDGAKSDVAMAGKEDACVG